MNRWAVASVVLLLVAAIVVLIVAFVPAKSSTSSAPADTGAPEAAEETVIVGPGAPSRTLVRNPGVTVISETVAPVCATSNDTTNGHCSTLADTYVTTVYELTEPALVDHDPVRSSGYATILLADVLDNEVRVLRVTVEDFQRGLEGGGTYLTPDRKFVDCRPMDTVFEVYAPEIYLRHRYDSVTETTPGRNETLSSSGSKPQSRWSQKLLSLSHEFSPLDLTSNVPFSFGVDGYNAPSNSRFTGVPDHYVEDDVANIRAPCGVNKVAAQTCHGSTPVFDNNGAYVNDPLYYTNGVLNANNEPNGDDTLKCEPTGFGLLFHRGFRDSRLLPSFIDEYKTSDNTTAEAIVAAKADAEARGYNTRTGGRLYVAKGARVTITWRYPSVSCLP